LKLIVLEYAKQLDAGVPMRQDQYMGSREWLEKYGLKARKLGFYDVLASVAFKHQDGVVDIKMAPDRHEQTDAVSSLFQVGHFCEFSRISGFKIQIFYRNFKLNLTYMFFIHVDYKAEVGERALL
jgi:hypothetical protein